MQSRRDLPSRRCTYGKVHHGEMEIPRPTHDVGVLIELMRAIASRDDAAASNLLSVSPGLATARLEQGATRSASEEFFLDEAKAHVYAGDTALHVAAFAYGTAFARKLVAAGAGVRPRTVGTRMALEPAPAVGSRCRVARAGRLPADPTCRHAPRSSNTADRWLCGRRTGRAVRSRGRRPSSARSAHLEAASRPALSLWRDRSD